MKEKYLPVGTVVLLKEATKKLVITGYCSSTPEDPNAVYDYVGHLFPEGSLAGESVALFNHDQIGIIAHMGLINDEFNELDKKIKEAMSETAIPVNNSVDGLPPFTPENINLMLEEIHKHEDDFRPVAEPTAFNEEVMKKPVFELPTLDGGSRKEEVKEDDEEEEVAPAVEEKVADGTPVLQLQPIFEGAPAGDSAPSVPSTPVSDGISELTRL